MDISQRLKEHLENKQITQYYLAKASEVTPAYVSQIISGAKTPTLETIKKFCDVMGVSLSEFFSDAEPEIKDRFDSLHKLVDEVPEERREEVRRFIEFTIRQHKREEK